MGYSILQVEVEGEKMGIQSALLLVSFFLLGGAGAVNCKSPLMRLLQFTLCSPPLSSSLKYFTSLETICGKYEKKLLRHLMADYDSMERPVEDEGEPLMLTFGVTLQQIIDVVSVL